MNDKELEKGRQALIAQCKYYHGEKENPFEEEEEDGLLWEYEERWVHTVLEDSEVISILLEHYKRVGLEEYRKNDGFLLSLKALLFERYSHWVSDDPKHFKEFYEGSYRPATSTSANHLSSPLISPL